MDDNNRRAGGGRQEYGGTDAGAAGWMRCFWIPVRRTGRLTLAAMQVGVELTNPLAVLEVMDDTEFDVFSRRRRFESRHRRSGCDNGHSLTAGHRKRQIYCLPASVAAGWCSCSGTFAGRFEKVVTEGRDQGTVVFPNAAFKFFLTADRNERARRRHDELKGGGKEVDFETLNPADCRAGRLG